eukprot:NODE_3833_length_518_cov_72.814499_g3263_i0.p1 GENE.NODE_3833_length_518_cov_72.814499_g3263_i0~~NODE_3833_length_518_cov_72.814499_g3263_i0.p1  ORF type:complete len:69 (-),score=7.39 NODE_3833_length_518_cov_72.814499_g3263_i0:51-257(-)
MQVQMHQTHMWLPVPQITCSMVLILCAIVFGKNPSGTGEPCLLLLALLPHHPTLVSLSPSHILDVCFQ